MLAYRETKAAVKKAVDNFSLSTALKTANIFSAYDVLNVIVHRNEDFLLQFLISRVFVRVWLCS